MRDESTPGLARRTLLAGGAAAAAGAAAGPLVPRGARAQDLVARIAAIPVEQFGIDLPVAVYRDLQRHYFFDLAASAAIVEKLWRAYLDSGDTRVAESVLAATYGWWRTEARSEPRLKIARAGRRMAERIRNDLPNSPAPYCWDTVFIGLEILTKGVLDALHLVPDYVRQLDAARQRDPAYFHGLATGLLAKAYLKTPPKPLSIGDLDAAERYLEDVRPLQEGKVATWYLFYAEWALQTQGTEAARAWLQRLRRECRPVDSGTAHLYNTALFDAGQFENVLKTGTYDKYAWDPLLVPAQPGGAY